MSFNSGTRRYSFVSQKRLPRQANQRYLLTGPLQCPTGGARRHGSRYRCGATNLGASAETREYRTWALCKQVDEVVISEVLPIAEAAVSSLPEPREALDQAWAALRQPTSLQDELQERQRQQLLREAEPARG